MEYLALMKIAENSKAQGDLLGYRRQNLGRNLGGRLVSDNTDPILSTKGTFITWLIFSVLDVNTLWVNSIHLNGESSR